jgi:hypothetical protein
LVSQKNRQKRSRSKKNGRKEVQAEAKLNAESEYQGKIHLHSQQKDRHEQMGDESAVEQNQKDSPEKKTVEKSSSVLRRK